MSAAMPPVSKPAGDGGDVKGRLAFLGRAFKYRNYRLFFGGQLVSLIGTWITTTATSWLVYRLTGSAFLLGLVGFAGQLPGFLFAPVAGVFVDRWNRHTALLITQALSMAQSFALAALVLGYRVTYTAIVLLSVAQGVINAFDMPTRQTFVVGLIEDRDDLGNVIGLNSSMFNAARLMGPTIAALIIAVSNEGWCFFIDGVSYLAVLASLLAMRLPERPMGSAAAGSAKAQFVEGWRYVRGSHPIRSIILLLALVSLLGLPYAVLVPVFASKVLGGGPYTLGFLMTASGCGALIGALWLASRSSVVGLAGVIARASTIFSIGLLFFALSKRAWLSCLIMPVLGFGFIVQMAASNTIVQTIVDEDKRGRVMSFFMMAFLGTGPFGCLLAGSLADRIGAPATVFLCGAACLVGASWFRRTLPELRAAIRPIYQRMGILPVVATGLQTASNASAEVTGG